MPLYRSELTGSSGSDLLRKQLASALRTVPVVDYCSLMEPGTLVVDTLAAHEVDRVLTVVMPLVEQHVGLVLLANDLEATLKGRRRG